MAQDDRVARARSGQPGDPDRRRPPAARNGGNGKSHPTRDKPQIFPDVGSRDVNAYLSEILPGLTAKVFRTHHATMAVRTAWRLQA